MAQGTRTVNGVTYQRGEDGRWYPQGSQQPLIARPADPSRDADARRAENQADASEYAARIASAQARQAEANAEIARLTADTRARQRGPQITPQVRSDIANRLTNTEGFRNELNELERVFSETFAGGRGGLGGFGSERNIAGLIPDSLRNDNQRFREAGNRLLGYIAQAQGITASQSNTPAEMEQRYGSYLPRPGDSDTQIREKLNALWRMVGTQARGISAQLGQPATQDRSSTVTVAPGTGQGAELSDGDEVMDPQAAARHGRMRQRLSDMLKSGASDDEIRAFAISNGASRESIDQVLEFRRSPRWNEWRARDPNGVYPWDNENLNRPAGIIEGLIADATNSPAGAVIINAGNAVVPTPWVGAAFGNNPDTIRADLAAVRDANPGSSLLGTIAGTAGVYGGAGGIANSVGRGGAGVLSRFLAPAEVGAFTPRALAGDAVYGAVQGAGETGSPISGAAVNAGGGIFGRSLFRGAGRALEGSRNLTTRALTAEGVPLTIGQMARARGGVLGRFIGGLEDRMAGFSGVGDLIADRRLESLEGFNRAGFRQAGAPINANVRLTGPAGITQGQRQTSDAYNAALNPVTLNIDQPFMTGWQAAREGAEAIPNVGDQAAYVFNNQVGNLVEPGGALSGPNFQAGRQYMRDARGNPPDGPMQQPFRDAMTAGEDVLTGLIERQAPGTMPALRNADEAYRNFSILGDALLPAQRGARPDELFTPGNLGSAAVNNTINFGGRNAARGGRTPFRALTRLGSVIPNQVPDSGSAGRAGLGLTAFGAGTGAGVGYAAGGDQQSAQSGGLIGTLLALGLLAPGTAAGRSAIQGALVRRPASVRRAGRAIADGQIPRIGGIFGAPLATYYSEDDLGY